MKDNRNKIYKHKWSIGMLGVLLLSILFMSNVENNGLPLPEEALAASSSDMASFIVKENVTGDKDNNNEKFIVELKAGDAGTPMPGDKQGTTSTITVPGGGTGSFGTITYQRAGIYNYTIKQIAGSTKEYTYDKRAYDVTVYVSDGAAGLVTQTVIKLQGSNQKSSTVDFWNKYQQEQQGTESDLVISTVIVNDTSSQETFQITIVFEGNGSGASYIYTDNKGNILGTIKSGDTINLANGESIRIESLPLGLKYKITQGQKGHYIPNPITGVISGKIKAGTNKVRFKSYYDPDSAAPVSIDPPVEKQIAGDTPKKSALFYFKMEAEDKSYPMPEGSSNGKKTVTIKGAGWTETGWITYKKPGTYKYTVSEVDKGVWGYGYDKQVYKVIVEVTEADGILSASRIIKSSERSGNREMVFVNVYSKDGKAVSKDSKSVSKDNQSTGIHGKAVATGDESDTALPAAAMVLAIVTAIIIKKRSGRRKKHDRGKQ